ncbi:MAG: hypothetical protein AB7U98_12145 [Candidatus Nitrosocosmicus sp.]
MNKSNQRKPRNNIRRSNGLVAILVIYVFMSSIILVSATPSSFNKLSIPVMATVAYAQATNVDNNTSIVESDSTVTAFTQSRHDELASEKSTDEKDEEICVKGNEDHNEEMCNTDTETDQDNQKQEKNSVSQVRPISDSANSSDDTMDILTKNQNKTETADSSLISGSPFVPQKPCISAFPASPIYYAWIVSPEFPSKVTYPDKVTATGEASGPCPISWIKFTWYLNGDEIASRTYDGSSARSSFTITPEYPESCAGHNDQGIVTKANHISMRVEFSDGTIKPESYNWIVVSAQKEGCIPT